MSTVLYKILPLICPQDGSWLTSDLNTMLPSCYEPKKEIIIKPNNNHFV